MKKVTEIVAELARPVVEEHGCTLWDVEYVREAGQWYLRLLIDKQGGVDILDCEAISRVVSDLLDEMGEYVFESGSYGKTAHMVMYLANEDGKNSFSAAVKRKLFISPSEMRRRSRAVDRCPLLLPFAYLVRAVKIVFTRFREFRAWMRGVKAADSEAVKKYKEMMRRFGVN